MHESINDLKMVNQLIHNLFPMFP